MSQLIKTMRSTLAIVALSGWMISVASPQVSHAQEFDVLPFAEKYQVPKILGIETPAQTRDLEKKIKDVEKLIATDQKAASAALQGAGATTLAQSFFQEYLFPKMTELEPATLSSFGQMRADFLKDFLGNNVSPATRASIIDLALPELQKIAEGNYHPASRLNAMIMIGSFNSREGDSTTFPQPHAGCVKYLLTAVERDNLPEFIKVGAMTGLQRVAEIAGYSNNIDAADLQKISEYATKILKDQAAGQAEWDSEVSYWLKRRATQVLGFLRSPGTGGDVVATLSEVAAEPKNRLWLRADAVNALSQIDGAVPEAQSKESIEAILAFTADALEADAKAIYAQIEEFVTVSLLFDNTYLMDSGKLDGGGGRGRSGGPGVGSSGLEGGGREGDGAGPGQAVEDNEPKFDLPNYSLNSFRRQAKSYLVYSQLSLSKRVQDAALNDADVKKRALDAVKIVKKALADTDIGLVDLKKDPRETVSAEDKKKSVADKLHDSFLAASSQLRALAPRAEVPVEPAGGNQ